MVLDADHAHRHRRRPGLHRRVPRPGHRGALHGGPDDGLQHEHRVGRQGRPDRARPDHLRLHRGPCPRRRRAPTGTPRSSTGSRWSPTTTPSSTRRSCSTRATMTPFVTWGTNPGQGVPLGGAVPDPAQFEDPDDRDRRREGARVHGPRGRHPDARGQGRHRLRRLVHQRPHRGPPPRRRDHQGPHGRQGHPPARRTRFGAGADAGRGRGSRRRLQGGRRRVARRRVLHVPGHEPRPARPRASAARRRPTATSRDVRARADARTSCRCRSPLRPPSAARSRRPPTCEPLEA